MVATWSLWSIPKRDPKLTGFIWYVKLHGKHCPNLLLPVRWNHQAFPSFIMAENRGEGLGFFYFLVSQLTLCGKKKNPLWEDSLCHFPTVPISNSSRSSFVYLQDPLCFRLWQPRHFNRFHIRLATSKQPTS